MDKFGDFGYSGFFIILELYGQEFNHLNNDGFLKISKSFLQRKLRKRWTKVELLLNFFSKEIIEPRFLWHNDGEYIFLQVPKFIEIASNWVGRKKKAYLQSPSVAPTAIEEEVEVEEKTKKIYTLNSLLEEIENKFSPDELKHKSDFMEYWKEKKPGGKKERWEMEKVFDINRRFRTWLKNNMDWGNNKPKAVVPDKNEPKPY